MKKPELLAPAGSFEKAKIAFMYGADAVYCGTSKHSLRTRTAMDYEDLKSLNYALVKEVTPPKKEYKIRFPLGMGESARYVINNMD